MGNYCSDDESVKITRSLVSMRSVMKSNMPLDKLEPNDILGSKGKKDPMMSSSIPFSFGNHDDRPSHDKRYKSSFGPSIERGGEIQVEDGDHMYESFYQDGNVMSSIKSEKKKSLKNSKKDSEFGEGENLKEEEVNKEPERSPKKPRKVLNTKFHSLKNSKKELNNNRNYDSLKNSQREFINPERKNSLKKSKKESKFSKNSEEKNSVKNSEIKEEPLKIVEEDQSDNSSIVLIGEEKSIESQKQNEDENGPELTENMKTDVSPKPKPEPKKKVYKPGENKYQIFSKIEEFKIKSQIKFLVMNQTLSNWDTMNEDLGSIKSYLKKSPIPEDELYYIKTEDYYYIGELNKYQKFHGFGNIYYPNKEYYKGDFKHGVYSGKGLRVKRSGHVYVGYFKNGMAHGPGRKLDNAGIYEEGRFRYDKEEGVFKRFSCEGEFLNMLKFMNGRAV